jgi:hypothetical protein
MSWSIVQTVHNNGSGATASATLSSTTAGNLLVALVSAAKNPGDVTFTPPANWTQDGTTQHDDAYVSDSSAVYIYQDNPGSITSVSFTLSSSASSWTCTLLEISGAATSSVTDGIQVGIVGSTGRTSGNLTTTTNGDLILGLAVIDAVNAGAPTFTEASGYTSDVTYNDGGGWFTIHVGYQTQATAGSIAYAPTWTTVDDATLYVVAFKPASGGSTHNLAAIARDKFLSRALLAEQTRSHFDIRHPLGFPDRAEFKTRADLEAESRDKFLTRAVLEAENRAKFVSRAVLDAPARDHFVTRAGLATDARATFKTRISKLVTDTWNHFLVGIASGHALAAIARSHFISRADQQAQSRAKFETRVPLQTETRSTFKTRFKEVIASRSKFLTRSVLQAASRSKFTIRKVLTALARDTFKINATVINYPFRVTATLVKALLTLVFAQSPQLSLDLSASPNLSLKFLLEPPVAYPNSTITVTATATDINGNPVSDMATVTVTVTFPDASTQNFSLSGSTVTNVGSGKYSITYTTKTPGQCLEDWVMIDPSGNKTEYHNITPVGF